MGEQYEITHEKFTSSINLGVNTNNAAKLIALLQGLILVGRYKLLPLIVEGDSEIIITLTRKLQMGAQV